MGCGRKVTEDSIDPTAGMEVLKKPGDNVEAGEPLLICFCSDETRLKTGCEMALSAYKISDESPAPEPLIYALDPAQ
ncbi:MAG: hypothetical protein GXO90_08020 [FCB group bacterium]|nr:hypothetical protein [FCB group bacterium]